VRDRGSPHARGVPIAIRATLFTRGAMTDPRFHDLTELSRRMTSSLDVRALTEDLVSWAIHATGAVTAAITLWDRERDVCSCRATDTPR
jgi:hypothetical protein